MIQTSMIDLASNGGFATCCHDLDHTELGKLLGDPDDWGTQMNQDQAEIWLYGDIEFHFNSRRVYQIFSDHADMTDGTESLRIEPWIVSRGLPRQKFEAALADQSISFETVIPDYDPFQRLLTTKSGAIFTFIEGSEDSPTGLSAWSIQTRAQGADGISATAFTKKLTIQTQS